MKPILVPVDFSPGSDNAAQYAALLADKLRAEIILLHVYSVPAQIANVPFVTAEEIRLHDEAMKELAQFAGRIKQENRERKVYHVTRTGRITDNIIATCTENDASMIVMGINGTGALDELFIGSHAIDACKRSPMPVIMIPRSAKFRDLRRIVFASELGTESTKESLQPVEDILTEFNSCIELVRVMKPGESSKMLKDAVERMEERDHFRNCSHSTHFIYSKDTIGSLSEFIKDRDADAIAVVPHHHNIFDRILKRSITRKLAFHSDVPIIVIPPVSAKEPLQDKEAAPGLKLGLDDQLKEAI